MLKMKDLVDGREYLAAATDGRKYRGVFVDKYAPGGTFFSCWPAFCPDGKTENKLLYFEEAN